jgi:hypothetical protein
VITCVINRQTVGCGDDKSLATVGDHEAASAADPDDGLVHVCSFTWRQLLHHFLPAAAGNAAQTRENRHMRRRGDFLDARISQRALDLYKLGRGMLRDGVDPSSAERIDVAFGLNRALKLPPWNEVVVDLEAYAINPAKLESALPKRPSSRHARQVRVGPCMDGAHGARRI